MKAATVGLVPLGDTACRVQQPGGRILETSQMEHQTQVAAKAAATQGVITSIREFLAFKLGSEEYGIDILRVQEIRSYEEPTRMANAPAFIKGVINLRGVIVPIVDMRIKFGLSELKYDNFTLTPEQLRPVPEITSAIGSDHLLAIGSLENRMLILLDIEKLMSSADMGLISQTVQ